MTMTLQSEKRIAVINKPTETERVNGEALPSILFSPLMML
jgi:hypothetical protein